MNRRTLAVLLVVAVGATIVLLVPTHQDDPHARPIPREPADGRAADEQSERSSPSLQGVGPTRTESTERRARAPSLFGRVVDRETGAGVGGARLLAYLHADVSRVAWTDDEGRFGIHNLTFGTWWLLVWHPEYVPAGLDELLTGAEDDAPPSVMQVVVPHGAETLPRRVIELTTGRRIEGQVVDASGRPLAGVEVFLGDGAWRKALDGRLHHSFFDYEEHVPMESDRDGRFVVACLPPPLAAVRLGAAGRGHVSPWSDEISLDGDEGTAQVVLQAVKTATVSGHVRLADGTPVTAARVSLDWGTRHAMQEAWAVRGLAGVDVDAQGAYSVPGLPPEPLTLGVEWRRPHMSGEERELDPLEPGEVREGVDFTLPRRHLLEGRLVTVAGGPLAKECLLAVCTPDGDSEGAFRRQVWTNEDGAFSATTPHAGPYVVSHERPCGQEDVLREGVVLPVEGLVLVSTATPRTRVVIRALDSTGAVVPRFRSAVWRDTDRRSWFQEGNPFVSTEVGRGGLAEHHVLGEAPLSIRVWDAWDAQRRDLPLGEARGTLATVPADGIADVVLPRADEVRGRFVDRAGRPVADVTLTLEDDGADPPTRTPLTVEADGSFSHRTGDANARHLSMEVTVPPGYVVVPSELVEVGTALSPYVLQPGGVLGGRVVTANAPLLEPGAEPMVVRVRWSDWAPSVVAPVDEEGRWRAETVPVGRDLEAQVPEALARAHGYQPHDPIENLRAGNRSVEIHLARGLAIAGRVLEADGSPVPEGRLTAWCVSDPSGQAGLAVVSATDGRFLVGGLGPGTYRLQVRTGDRAWVRFDLGTHEAGARDLDLRLPKRDSLRVHVVGQEVTGGCSVEVWVDGTTSQRGLASFDGDPPFEVVGLPKAERYTIGVRCRKHVGTAGGVRTGDDVGVMLTKALPLRGHVRRRDGTDEPRPGALFAVREGACFRLTAFGSGLIGWLRGGDRAVAPGAFAAIHGVAPGRYEIRHVQPDGTWTVLARSVEAGREDLELVLE